MFASVRSFVDRYFTRHYFTDVMNKPNEDMCVLAHSNEICVLTLAPSHPVFQQIHAGLTIKSVDYKVTQKLDRMENKVSGKSKRGAQCLAPDSPVCRILCGENGDVVYTIRACVKGRLVEVNERLINEPNLLAQSPEMLGYICVILQKRSFLSDGVNDTSAGIPEENVSSHRPISYMDRASYLRLRYPDSCDGHTEQSVVMKPIDDVSACE